MKRSITISRKVLFVFLLSFIISILFSSMFIHFLYKDLYIDSIKEQLLYEGEQTASHFHYGSLTEEIREKIAWYNAISPYEIIAVDELEQLDQYFPYQVNYSELIHPEDEKLLLSGQYVMKEGYVKEFQRNIVGAIYPIIQYEKLIGFIYIYVPVGEIPEVFSKGIPLLVFFGTIFFLILFLIINYFVHSIFRPLNEIRAVAKKVGKGDFSHRVHVDTADEIGELAATFNKMTASLEEQDIRKREFLSNVAHELRTPLTYIGGYSKLLIENEFTSEKEQKRHLLRIEKEAKRMQKLIQDLLQLNRIEEKDFAIQKEPIAFAQFIFDSLDLFTASINEKQMTIQTDLDDEVIIMGDPLRLQQVIYNVVDNAIKYSNKGGIIRIQLRRKGEKAILSIVDYGIGIPAEDLHRIGERFYRTDKSRSRKTGGTGLGLSIVKSLMNLHDGTMDITSEEGKGTTVHLTFPII